MRFVHPMNLLWLLPLAGLIVLMYILKLRRKDVVVSSTYLWQQVIRDTQANAPFQKLRKNLLLLLQLLLAMLLVFALARPFLRLFTTGGRAIVLIVDASASMRATDVAPSRLEAARRQARERIDALRPGDRMMILAAAVRPEALCGFTQERAELRRALDSLRPRDTPANMRDALNLAADLVASRREGGAGLIELISDGGFASASGAQGDARFSLAGLDLGDARVTYFPIGQGRDNVGITAVDFRRNLGAAKTVQLLVVTQNFAAQPRTFTQEVYAGEDIIDAQEMTLPPGGEETLPVEIPEPAQTTRLRVRLDLQDALAADNEAALILTPRRPLNVLLVGREDLFLENAIKVDPGVELSRTERFTSGKGFDVVVFSDSAPAQLPPGNYLFLHCASDQAPVRIEGSEKNVAVADWERDHPVLRYVDFGSERFGSALRASPLEWGRELATGDSGALVVAGEKPGTRAVFAAFSLSESLFPLRVAFPIFIANSVRWLGTGRDDFERGQVATGTPVTIPAPPGLARLTVTKPDGATRELAAGERGGAVFDETDQVGVYTAQGNDFTYPFAANLASAAESDITPRPTLTLTETNPAPPAGRRVADNRELLPWLLLLALLLLAVEWWAFHRRVSVS